MEPLPTGTPEKLRRRVATALATAVLVLVLTVCGSASKPTAVAATKPASVAQPTRRLKIVAGENFWGSIVSQLAGTAATVTSIVTDPNADPHDYESSSDDARAFVDADYVVLNGAGYDGWASRLLSGNPSGRRRVLTVADLLAKKEGDNPHFWYNPDFVSRVADRVESDLKALDPADAGYFDARRQALDAAMAPSRDRLAAIRSRFAGTPVAATEDIFVYLGRYLGLRVISPPEFMQAVAEGNDPPAPSVAQFHNQIASRQAKVLVYNLQTSTAVTTNIKKLATQAGVPTIGVTETIQPPGATFQQWFTSELIRLQDALNAAAPPGGGS